MHFTPRIKKIIVGFFLGFLLAIIASTSNSFAVEKPGGSSGGQGGKINSCGSNPGAICYSSHNDSASEVSGGGGEWVKIFIKTKEFESVKNSIPYSMLRGNYRIDKDTDKHIKYGSDPKVITGCGEADYIYVFISHTYINNPNSNPPYPARMTGYGPNSFSNFWEHMENGITVEQRYVKRAGDNHADYNEAKDAYFKYVARTGQGDDAVAEAKWRQGQFSWFCSWDAEKKPDCDPNDPTCNDKIIPPTPTAGSLNCGRDLPGVSTSPYKGNTVADSGVVNLSYTGTLDFRNWQNTTKGKNYVLARPGDSVRFKHSMCYTAQAVGRTLQGRPTPDKENHFQIYAKRNGSEDSRYLFGQSELLDGNQRTVHAHTQHQIRGNGIISADYGFTTESPTGNPTPDYLCNSPILLNSNNRGIQNGFQIPGFATGVTNCNSANRTTNNSEVGSVISQGLRYDDIRTWVSYTTQFVGRCGCERDEAYENHFKQTSYDTAGTSSDPRTEWGQNYVSCRASGTCHKGEDTRYKPTYTYEFPLTTENRGTKETESKVYVPYNFNTYVTSFIDAEDIAFAGEQVDIGGSYHILPRQNDVVAKNAYATVTSSKETFRIYEMILPIYANPNTFSGNERSAQDVCQYYGISNCNLVNTINGPMNASGNYSGESKNTGTYSRTIPDNEEYVGFKYCTATSIWPASSHVGTTNTVDENISGPAMNGGDESKYNVSDLSCITIAKKPNFQVWGGGMYTNGSIETSVSKKVPGSGFNPYPNGTEKIFGSWDEYHVIAGSNVSGFGSGASLGYERGYRFDVPTGGANLNDSRNNLTVASRGRTGYSGVPGLPSSLLARLKARYRDNIEKISRLKITTHDTGLQNAYIKGDVNLSQISLPDYNPNAASTLGVMKNSLYKTLSADDSKNNTLVLYVDGTLNIDQNICYATSGYYCEGISSTIQNNYADIATNSITKLPQILIFAKQINVSDQVTRIDAWLILDEDNAPNNLNTCSNYAEPSALVCSKTLVFNGPVFAKSLTLRRTGGANHGGGIATRDNAGSRELGTSFRHLPGDTYYFTANDGSVAPGEIFNLRSDAYYWGMGQAQRSGIAEVVYQRELAPRY